LVFSTRDVILQRTTYIIAYGNTVDGKPSDIVQRLKKFFAVDPPHQLWSDVLKNPFYLHFMITHLPLENSQNPVQQLRSKLFKDV